ncbi:hypothetical protein AAE478_003431 [Parahypoxylon ruwenzoriense]
MAASTVSASVTTTALSPKSILKRRSDQDQGRMMSKRHRAHAANTDDDDDAVEIVAVVVTFDEVARDLETGEHVPKSERSHAEYMEEVARRKMWGMLQQIREQEKENKKSVAGGDVAGGEESEYLDMVLFRRGGDNEENGEDSDEEYEESDEESGEEYEEYKESEEESDTGTDGAEYIDLFTEDIELRDLQYEVVIELIDDDDNDGDNDDDGDDDDGEPLEIDY